jgi:hypothetical protein
LSFAFGQLSQKSSVFRGIYLKAGLWPVQQP